MPPYTPSSVLGPIAPVGPTSFEFNVPDGAPLTLAPSVGTVMPGKVGAGSVSQRH